MENLEYNLAILKSEKENTQFALDRDLAGAIFVLRHENDREKERIENNKPGFFGKRRRRGWI